MLEEIVLEVGEGEEGGKVIVEGLFDVAPP